MKGLNMLRRQGESVGTEYATPQDLRDLLYRLGSKLGYIQIIEENARDLRRIVANDEKADKVGMTAIILAGEKAIVEYERDQMRGSTRDIEETCIGAKVKVMSRDDVAADSAPQLYDRGDDCILGPSDSITGVISGVGYGWGSLSGTDVRLDLDKATSTIYPEKELSSPALPISVHHFFSRNDVNGLLTPTISLELLS